MVQRTLPKQTPGSNWLVVVALSAVTLAAGALFMGLNLGAYFSNYTNQPIVQPQNSPTTQTLHVVLESTPEYPVCPTLIPYSFGRDYSNKPCIMPSPTPTKTPVLWDQYRNCDEVTSPKTPVLCVVSTQTVIPIYPTCGPDNVGKTCRPEIPATPEKTPTPFYCVENGRLQTGKYDECINNLYPTQGPSLQVERDSVNPFKE